MKTYTKNSLEKIKHQAPLVHNITNFVVMNSSANILLAVGASPVMAHCKAEVEEMASIAGALVLNIGTLQEDWVASMICAGKAANAKGIPIILDPVGSGATKLRTQAVKEIMSECAISVLRGNCSEILSLGSDDIKTKGVDSSMALTHEIVKIAKQMALDMNCVIAMSGAEDCITDGNRVFRVKNGQPLMTKVTGGGCGLTAVVGAFCAVEDKDMTCAATAAFGFYGMCADLAVMESNKPGSFFVAFLDHLYSAGEEEIEKYLDVHDR